MKVLVACEFSGIVRRAFEKHGHHVISCDLLPAEDHDPHHIVGDVRNIIDIGARKYDLMIAFPPCTHLAVSGARWFKDKQREQQQALQFILELMNAPIPLIAIENPIGVISTKIRKPDQIIQPWQFGHPETKATCLWLEGLSKLKPTNIVEGREPRVHLEPPCPDQWKNRSRTYQGIAEAMAEQWGNYIHEMKARVIPRQSRNYRLLNAKYSL